MDPKPTPRLSLPRKLAIAFVGALAAALLFLWLALPRIIQSQAEKFVAEKTGHRLTLDRPEFNPFELSLRLHKLQLTEPDGKPLLAFDGLLVDISAASLTRRALVFDAIRLDGPALTVVELADGGLNWSAFITALKGKEQQPETSEKGLPRLDIQSFVLAGGMLDFADQRTTQGFATRVEPLELSLSDISTFPDDNGKFSFIAQTALGAKLKLGGEVALNPLAVTGSFSLEDLQLAQFAPYLKDALPAPPQGKLALSANYRAGNTGEKLAVTVEQIEATLLGMRVPLDASGAAHVAVGSIALKGGSFDLSQQLLAIGSINIADTRLALPRIERSLALTSISLEDARINLAERQATLAKLALANGELHGARSPGGEIYLVNALEAIANSRKGSSPASNASGEKAPAQPWRFRLDRFSVADFEVSARDEGVSPAAEFALKKIALEVTGITENLDAALPVKLAMDVASGGHFEAAGTYVPATVTADFKLRLVDLALQPVQPYLASQTTLVMADGKFSTQGQLGYSAKGPNYRGEFAVNNLRLVEPGNSQPLLAWKSLASRDLRLLADRVDLSELRLDGLDTRLIINKDKTLNFKKVIKQPAVAANAPAPEPAKAAAEPAKAAPGFLVNIDRLRFSKGQMEFADYSLVLPFGTRIHGLRGTIGNISSRPGALGQVELDGEVDDYGMARAAGQVDFFNPTDSMDLRVVFRNVEMTRLTPYMATFVGRKIDSGKLSLDLQYKIKQRQMQGENQVIMDSLTLGERVESATAKELPLDLAIAILKDSDGRIDLGLPVAGSLDDPEFSYGAVVWKAITNVLTKIVTAPFRALGALFGGEEKLDSIVFEPGAGQLTPPEREKLVRLAGALGKRPNLLLAVGGAYAEPDRVALQEAQLRRTVLIQSGQRVPEKGDPGPLSTQQPQVQSTLESLYADRVGKSDLAALKEGFRQANPGQLEEGAAGKMISRLSGMMREKKSLSADEVTQLKGADFYAVLFERLRARELVADERLLQIAKQRGESALETLKTAGAAPERLTLSAPEKTAGDERGVGLRLALEPAKVGSKAE